MYDIHMGDRFANEDTDEATHVIVREIELDGSIKYEYEASGAKRTVSREFFLERFPIVL